MKLDENNENEKQKIMKKRQKITKMKILKTDIKTKIKTKC